MRKLAPTVALTATPLLLLVAACADEQPAPPPGNDVNIVIDDECPRADGEPCR